MYENQFWEARAQFEEAKLDEFSDQDYVFELQTAYDEASHNYHDNWWTMMELRRQEAREKALDDDMNEVFTAREEHKTDVDNALKQDF